MNPDFSLVAYLNERKALVDGALDDYLPGGQNDPSVIVQAIRYSLLAVGKRIGRILFPTARRL